MGKMWKTTPNVVVLLVQLKLVSYNSRWKLRDLGCCFQHYEERLGGLQFIKRGVAMREFGFVVRCFC
jgi:hypothetical protein